MYDIAIIGAGPAGATLARLIGRQYKVLLADKRPFTHSGEFGSAKCCGGLLAPDAQQMLSRFGLGLPLSVLEEPQLFVVKAIDLQGGLKRSYQRHYINMNRRNFDHWLVSLIPSAVDIRAGCRLSSFTTTEGGFRLSLKKRGRQVEERARILVAADGASSSLRKQSVTAGLKIKKYIAIQEWVEGGQQRPYFTSVFDSALTDFYCWTIPKGSYLVIGAALLPDSGTVHKFDLYKLRLQQNGFDFGKTIRREGAMILRPSTTAQLLTAESGMAFIGEAGGWISPSSAEGLSYAFRSAHYLAAALSTGPNGFEQRYEKAMKKLQRNILLKNIKSRVIFNPILRRFIMQIGVKAVPMGEDIDDY